MSKTKERALAYSLLAHVRETGKLISGPLDMFIPLIKRTLSSMNEKGAFMGRSIIEIKKEAEKIYNIDFPIPVLEKILKKIGEEINENGENRFTINNDKSFIIKNYLFVDFEETVQLKRREIDNLEKLFRAFCSTCDPSPGDDVSIIKFIESSKLSLSKYLSSFKKADNDFTVEAQFVDYFRNIPTVYSQIKNLYLGAIITSYLEFKPETIKSDVELIFDTNFILGLLDLNTPESTNTCQKLIEIAISQGYKLFVLQDTIDETFRLLKAKAENIDTSFLQRNIYPEDIYNACERRNINKADLERIADNLVQEISNFQISIIYETNKYQNIAKNSYEYQNLLKFRSSRISALHDATALHYVKRKRKKNIKEFENVNCWFVNNSINRGSFDGNWGENQNIFQPETIRADDLLNIMWLSNPQINSNLNTSDLAGIGLSSLISLTLTESLPKASIIRELENNIQKYAEENSITDKDVVRLATRITNKQLTDVKKLNILAQNNKKEFVKRIKEESKKQEIIEKQRIKKIDNLIVSFKKKGQALVELEREFKNKVQSLNEKDLISNQKLNSLERELMKSRELLTKEKNLRRNEKRDNFVKRKLKIWRRNTWIELCIWLLLGGSVILWILSIANWSLNETIIKFNELKSNIIISTIVFLASTFFSGITIKTLFQKYRNHSNIKAYMESIEIPEDLKKL